MVLIARRGRPPNLAALSPVLLFHLYVFASPDVINPFVEFLIFVIRFYINRLETFFQCTHWCCSTLLGKKTNKGFLTSHGLNTSWSCLVHSIFAYNCSECQTYCIFLWILSKQKPWQQHTLVEDLLKDYFDLIWNENKTIIPGYSILQKTFTVIVEACKEGRHEFSQCSKQRVIQFFHGSQLGMNFYVGSGPFSSCVNLLKVFGFLAIIT